MVGFVTARINMLSTYAFGLTLAMFSVVSSAHILIGLDDWEPYVNADRTGIADKKALCLMHIAGITPSYKKYPWPRIYKMITEGEIDISYPWSITPERSKDIIFSDAIFHDKEVLVHLRGTPIEWSNISDLSKFRVGAQIGYSHLQLLERNGVTPAVKVKTEKQLLGMLYSKRIDVFPINNSVLEHLVTSVSLDKRLLLEVSAKEFKVNTMHMISKNSKQGELLIKKINLAISSGLCWRDL